MESYKEIAEKLPAENAMLVHACAFSVDEKAILMMAPSGVGKTTQSMMWEKMLGMRFAIINDDKPILRLFGRKVMVESSPLCGKEGRKSEKTAELFSVIILDGSRDWEEALIETLDSKIAAEYILKQVYMPDDPKMRIRTIDLIDEMFSNVPIYMLKRNMTSACAEIAISKVLKDTNQ